MRSAFAITAIAALGATGQAAAQNNSTRPGLDVLRYVFEVEFPAQPLDQPISVRSTALVARSARADTLTLDLAAPMQLGRVMVNGVAAAVARDSSAVRVRLPAGTNDTLRVELEYRGQPRDGLIIRRDSLGFWTAFADHFPNRARQWLATVDHPADKAAVEWIVRTPATHRVVANGDLLEETPQLDSSGTPVRLLTRWRTMKPLYTAVMVIGVAPFAVYDLGETACGLAERPGCVGQSVWVTPDVRPSMPGPFARAGEMVALFSRLVGPYPYEKLAHVQSSTRYGGMENASAIFYSDRIYRRGTMSEGLIAHEAAHQWFGDAVTTREWPHVWLSEGFATYFAALWSEHSRGDSAFLADMRRMRDGVLRDGMAATHPVIHANLTDAANVLNGLVYGKAGFVLHMLRREVGDSAFFRGIRSYYGRYRHLNAVTADFQREIEAAAGTQLGWFFDQWMRRPGFAEITTSWQWDGARRVIDLTVTQGSRFAPFQLTLPVDVTDSSGRVHRIRVPIPASRVTTIPVPIRIDGPPRSIAFDADVSILGSVRPASP